MHTHLLMPLLILQVKACFFSDEVDEDEEGRGDEGHNTKILRKGE